MTTHRLLWNDDGLVPTPTIIWNAVTADQARELGRCIEGPYVLASYEDERIPDGTYGGAR
jgi:hypothetical protein